MRAGLENIFQFTLSFSQLWQFLFNLIKCFLLVFINDNKIEVKLVKFSVSFSVTQPVSHKLISLQFGHPYNHIKPSLNSVWPEDITSFLLHWIQSIMPSSPLTCCLGLQFHKHNWTLLRAGCCNQLALKFEEGKFTVSRIPAAGDI